MDKAKKEVVLDWDRYIEELKEQHVKSYNSGYDTALKCLTLYLSGKKELKELMSKTICSSWKPLLTVLGKKEDWEEIQKERASIEENKKSKEEEDLK